jgi:hypothetical protein
MFWKQPPIIKIYEALGCIADGRLEISHNTGKVWSSNKNKYYTITYSPEENAIMCNDNGSYWVGYLGYPAIAFLMQAGVLSYSEEYAQALKGISWKKINTEFKNDFTKTETMVRDILVQQGLNLQSFDQYLTTVSEQIVTLKIKKLGPRITPPKE